MALLRSFIAIFLLLSASAAIAEQFNVATAPIQDEHDAKNKCPLVCSNAHSYWTGKWKTLKKGKLSICICDLSPQVTKPIPKKGIKNKQKAQQLPNGSQKVCQTRNIGVGFLENEYDAKDSCPMACEWDGGKWTGKWHISRENGFCSCEYCKTYQPHSEGNSHSEENWDH